MGNEERNEGAERTPRAAAPQQGGTGTPSPAEAPPIPWQGKDGGAGGDGDDGAGELFTHGRQAEAEAQDVHAAAPKLSLAERMVENEWPAVVAVDLSDSTRAAIRAQAIEQARAIVKNGPKLQKTRAFGFRMWLDGFMTAAVPGHWPKARRQAAATKRALCAAARARREQQQQSNRIG